METFYNVIGLQPIQVAARVIETVIKEKTRTQTLK